MAQGFPHKMRCQPWLSAADDSRFVPAPPGLEPRHTSDQAALPNFPMTKIAEALDAVEAYDPKTVVRVNGLRALGDESLSIVARYFEKHFGSVERTVPVICQRASGVQKLSNFGFVVMSCRTEAEQVLAQDALVVNGCAITLRAFSVKPREAHAACVDSQGPQEGRPARAGREPRRRNYVSRGHGSGAGRAIGSQSPSQLGWISL